jgi:beta-aspartyl-peptidase (threonine type)
MGKPVVVVHGGAGSLNNDLREHGAACRDALREALQSAAAVLEEGQDAAVSCTGDGEAFIRAGAARLLAVLVARGATVDAAAQAALHDVQRCDGGGGLIAVDSRGNVAMSFTTDAMPRGVWRPGEEPALELS